MGISTKKKKIKVFEVIADLGDFVFMDSELHKVVQEFQVLPQKLQELAIVKKHKDSWISFEIEGDESCYDFAIFGIRLETDTEFEKRMKDLEKLRTKGKKEKLSKEEKEKRLYERLQKKFEGERS